MKVEKMVENSITCARALCDNLNTPVVRRVRRKRRMDGEETINVDLSADDAIRRDMIEVVDRLKVEMNDRFKQINLSCKFGFLLLPVLLDATNDNFIDETIDTIVTLYGYDEINAEEIKCEVRRLRRVILLSKSNKNNDCKELDKSTVLNLLKWIVKWGFMELLPNFTVLLRIFLTLCISVATSEGSFFETYACEDLIEVINESTASFKSGNVVHRT